MTFEMSKQQSLLLKAIAIIFVIMSHTGMFPCGGAIGVHLFLIISGYGIYCSLEKNVEGYWHRRIESVYLPYLFCTVIFLVVRFVKYGRMSFATIIVSLLGQDFNLNADPTMWYISYIFVCYLIAWGVFKFNKSYHLNILFAIFAFGAVTLCGYKYIIWHPGTIAWNYGASFPLGMLVARYRFVKGKKARNAKISILIISLVITLILLPVPHEKIIKLLFTLCFAIAVYSLLSLFSTTLSGKNCLVKICEFIGKQSYFMYLNEALIIGVLKLKVSLLNTMIITAGSFMLACVMNQAFTMFMGKIHYYNNK